MVSDRLALLVAAAIFPGALLGAEIRVNAHTPDGRPLSQAVVTIDAGSVAPAPSDTATAVINQINRSFVPHVSVIRRGTRVSFPNEDDIRHHVYSFSEAKTFELPLYSGTPSEPVVFDRAGIVTLACNIHDWMLAWVYVTDAVWFGVTDDEGQLTLRVDDHPTYAVTVWHPNMGPQIPGRTFTVEREDRHELSLEVPVEAAEGRGSRRLRRSPGRYR